MNDDALTAPPPIPTQGDFFIHLLKPIPGQTLTWHDVIPVCIRNPQEMHAAALMCSQSNVVAAFLRCTLSITADRLYVLLTVTRGEQSTKQHIPITGIKEVGRLLPRSYGVEAIGNPVSGSRISIKTNDRVCVVYAMTQGQQLEWFEYLSWRVEGQKPQNHVQRQNAQTGGSGTNPGLMDLKPKLEDVAPPPLQDMTRFGTIAAAEGHQWHTSGGASTSAGTESTLLPTDNLFLGASANKRFNLPVNHQMFSPKEVAEQTMQSLRTDAPRSFMGNEPPEMADPTILAQTSLMDHAVARKREMNIIAGSGASPSPARGTASTLAELRPIEFEDRRPDEVHLKWRFGDLQRFFSEEEDGISPKDMELVRKLREQEAPGRWSEVGQAEPLEFQADNIGGSQPAAAAASTIAPKSDPLGKYSALRMDGKVKTAADQLKRNAPSASKHAASESEKEYSSIWESICPWVSLDHRLGHEAQMMLLWRIAHLHIEPQDGGICEHKPLPQSLRTRDVEDYWKSEYQSAREEIQEKAGSLRERLGLYRTIKTKDSERKRIDVNALVPERIVKKDNDPLGLANMEPPPEQKKAEVKAEKKQSVAKQVGSFVKFLM